MKWQNILRKPEGKVPLGKPRHAWVGNIEILGFEVLVAGVM
jgi:hypothetical protein